VVQIKTSTVIAALASQGHAGCNVRAIFNLIPAPAPAIAAFGVVLDKNWTLIHARASQQSHVICSALEITSSIPRAANVNVKGLCAAHLSNSKNLHVLARAGANVVQMKSLTLTPALAIQGHATSSAALIKT
jgi:hypothetical protein